MSISTELDAVVSESVRDGADTHDQLPTSSAVVALSSVMSFYAFINVHDNGVDNMTIFTSLQRNCRHMRPVWWRWPNDPLGQDQLLSHLCQFELTSF